tara:strand:- start:1477 stop:2232 length:756 start_codon:yes stop_codon:yes gene_type:complete
MILVIGEICDDIFIYGSCSRICPEAPVPVFTPRRETQNVGMAGNVTNNLRALGEKVQYQYNQSRIEKKRIVDEKTNQMLVRIDSNDSCDRISHERLTLYARSSYKEFQNNLQAVVISDYDKGFLREEDIEDLTKIFSCPIFLDTKKRLGKWCRGVDFIKINDVEYDNSKDLIKDLKLKDKLIITRGGDGAEYKGKIYPTKKCAVQDLSGAGDTFLAALVHSYIKTHNIEDAIKFANEVATKVVQKRGVTTI